ncbi:MAG: sulfur carrier protein ThiS [Gammaproteobacteria bacterium]|nr:sulfur carrier protein ThiS [Gammaproteobacteria bacterium]
MQVFINGEPVVVERAPLEEVLVLLGYEGKKVVVAVNEQFVPRTEWDLCELEADDRVDVLAAIQGG